MAEFKYDDFKGYEEKSYARLEFWALVEDIAPLLNKGLSTKTIYRYFKDKERLTYAVRPSLITCAPEKSGAPPKVRIIEPEPNEAALCYCNKVRVGF